MLKIELLMRITTLVKNYFAYLVLLVSLFGNINSLYSQCPTIINATQSFCDIQSPTIASLEATDQGGGIKWYANATGGTALLSSASLTNGEDYFADDNTGACGTRQSVVVTIYSAPTGLNFQGVCVNNANLATPSNPQFVISGNGLRWYTQPNGGTALLPNAILSDNTIYYISQTNPSTGCETSRFPLFVNVGIVPVPDGFTVQEFCSNTSPTVNDLVASGNNNWYLTTEFGIPLDLSTPLVNGQHYYATTVDPPCESSNRLDVLVNINESTVPVFTALGPYCQNATPETLLTTSTNGITGTWSPAVISTTTLGTQTYTFTPTAGLCATTTTMSITVDPNIVPVFTDLGPYCQNETPGTLPITSTNGITGTWFPAVISTTTLGTQTYTFTPTAGLCATTTTMSITVSPVLYSGTAISPPSVCTSVGTIDLNTLLTGQDAGGTWSTPSPIDISSFTAGTYTYTYSVTNVCGTDTEDVQFIVLPNPILTSSNIASSIVCVGLDVTVNLSGMVDGTYTLNYDLSGSNTLTNQNVTVAISGGIGSFTISSVNVPNAGTNTITFNTIQNTINTCQVALNNVTGTIIINPKVQIDDTNIVVSTICIGSVATVLISNATNLPNGVYQFNYSITTGTPAIGNSGDVTITGGSGQFTIPASVFATVGNYTLTINSIATTTGCSNTAEDANITFAVVAPLSAGTFTGITSVCPSTGIIDLASLLTGEIAGGVWTDSASQVVNSLINIISFGPGIYSYTYTVTNACGTDTEVVRFTVYANPQLATLNISTSPICIASNAIVNLRGMVDGTYTLNYDLNGSNILTSQTVIVTIASGIGSFTIPTASIPNVGTTVITFSSITNNTTTCTRTLTNVAVQIVIRPLADIDNANLSIANVCLGSNVEVNITGAINLPDGIYQFNYSIPDPTLVNGNSGNVTITSGVGQFTIPSTSFTITGNYTLTVTGIITATGCSNSSENAAASFTINAIPSNTGATVSAQDTCPNSDSNVTITGISNLPNGTYSLIYLLSGANSGTATISVTFTNGGTTFTIPGVSIINNGQTSVQINSLTSPSNTCGISGANALIGNFNVISDPAPTLIDRGDLFCGTNVPAPTIADLSANIVGTPNVIWYDALSGGTAFSPSDVLINGTTYFAAVVSVNGCESLRLPVTVDLTLCDVIIPDGFSPNNDGINDTFEIPNLTVLFPNFKLEIYNRYGSLIFTGNRNKENWDGTTTEGGLNLGDKLLATGVYFYILNFNDGTRKAIQGRLYLNR
jgi:gliding motility-associated-like protein